MIRAGWAHTLHGWRKPVESLCRDSFALLLAAAVVAGCFARHGAAQESRSPQSSKPISSPGVPSKTAESAGDVSPSEIDGSKEKAAEEGQDVKGPGFPKTKPLPHEVKPPVLLLPDKDGNLQTVPGFTLEDFVELYKLKNGLAQQARKPRYHIQRLTISGTASEQRAELAAEFSIQSHESGWVKVPLRLGTAILKDDPSYVGDGDHEVQLDEDSEGYVAWLRGDAEETHRLTLPLAVPLSKVGSETELRLSLPRATIASCKLEVVDRCVAVRIPDGTMLDTQAKGPKTIFSLSGLSDDFQLAWRGAESANETNPSVFDVAALVLARFDERSIGWDSRLTVRSYGAPFDRIRVRLPRGAELVPAPQAGMTITRSTSEANQPNVAVVEVKLDKKTVGPVEIRLLAERQRNAGEDDQPAELSGFDVVNALRQRGSIAVQIVGNWQVMWGESQNVRQVDEVPDELKRENLAASFEYFVQPFALSARIVPQRTRLTVDPEYVVLVGPQRTQLQAKLRYMVRGAKVRNLEVRLPGWEVDRVGPTNLLDGDAPLTAPDGRLTLGLLQPTSGEIEVTFEAHRDSQTSTGELTVDLPEPQAESVTPAIVAILPSDDVELTPKPDAISGLVPVSGKPTAPLPERQQEPIVLRLEKSPARFIADFKVHEQQISVDVLSQVQLDRSEVSVEQRYAFQVAYVPVDRIGLTLPASVPMESLKISLDGQTLVPAINRDDSDTARSVRVNLPLPRSRLGRFEVQLSYRLTQSKLLPAATVSLSVPLGMPRQANVVRNTAIVKSTDALAVAPMKGAWTADNVSGASERLGGLALSSKEPQVELPLAITLQEGQSDGSTTIERAWLQSWLTDRVRQDRAVFRFRSTEAEVRLVLPDGANVEQVEIRLDGRPAASSISKTRELVVPLEATADSVHVLDLRYQFPSRPLSSNLRFEAPRWKPALWMRQMYWQLVLPSNEHVLVTPDDLTSEFIWNWNGWFWQRDPTLEQDELEQWVKSEPSTVKPGKSNRYLFSTAGVVESLSVVTARRSLIVFVASLGVLFCGLALIYLPSARHPLPLVVGASVLVAAGIAEPETTLLLVQAAGLGLALVLIALLISRKSLKRLASAGTGSVSAYSLKDRSATELYHRPAKLNPSPSTATAPMAMQASSPDVDA